ncbi:MAG: Gfo/Idh/MocA family oxidoreductase [Planctomycetota bacterium]
MPKITRRDIVKAGLGAGVMMSLPAHSLLASRHTSPIETVNLGMISCGGRAGQLAKSFSKSDDVNIAGLCDPDKSRTEIMNSKYRKAQTWTDLRKMLENDSIDAVVVATCNHWHCLAAIWAMEAGKHVYVEKPLSHSQWEGRQTVAAARKFKRVCQIGTQQRSDPMQAEIKKFLHQDKALGEIKATRVNRIGRRASIGKRATALPIDKNVDYDVWLGPAQDKPIFRDRLHYDWHWDFNTGSGEMGNWGVHILDDVRNNVFQDKVTLPKRVFGGGGRISWNDAGESPNVHFAFFDTGSIPVVIALSNLAEAPGGKKSPKHPGPGSGYIVYCEGGRLEGQRGKAVAFDRDGKKLKEFKGNRGDGIHQANFIKAVQQQKPEMLNADVAVGHDSTGWCNLANIAFQAGSPFKTADLKQVDLPQWTELMKFMDTHTQAHNVKLESEEIVLSPMMTMNPETEMFVGENAKMGNKLLKREYRKGYEVPEIVTVGVG